MNKHRDPVIRSIAEALEQIRKDKAITNRRSKLMNLQWRAKHPDRTMELDPGDRTGAFRND